MPSIICLDFLNVGLLAKKNSIMPHFLYSLSILLVFLNVNAQNEPYSGGVGRGDVQVTRTNNLLDDPLIYYGGSGRGDVQLTRINNLLDDPLIYYGGSGRGDIQLTRTNNLLDNPLIYYGGSGRGDFMLSITGHLNYVQTWTGPLLSGNDLFSNGANWALGYAPQIGNIMVDSTAQRDMELVADLLIDTLFFQNSNIKVQHGNFNLSLNHVSNTSSTQLWRFQTNGTGSLVRPSIASGGSFTFPVGNSSYNPVTITNNTGISDDFSVRVTDAVLMGGTNGGAITTPLVNRTWHVGKSNPSANSGSGVDMSFQWDSAQETGVMSAYKLNTHTGGGWVLASGYGGSESLSGANPKTLNYTGYKGSFSLFAIGGSPVSPLPIVLKEFTAECAEESVMLRWITHSEINNERFTVHRSADLMMWEEVLTLPGGGNSNAPLSYTATDERPLEGMAYYRLTQQDYDGTAESFEPVAVFCSAAQNGTDALHVYPNPAEEFFTVSLKLTENLDGQLELSDMNGRVLLTRNVDVSSGNHSFSFDRAGIPSGTYVLRLRAANVVLSPVKVVVR